MQTGHGPVSEAGAAPGREALPPAGGLENGVVGDMPQRDHDPYVA